VRREENKLRSDQARVHVIYLKNTGKYLILAAKREPRSNVISNPYGCLFTKGFVSVAFGAAALKEFFGGFAHVLGRVGFVDDLDAEQCLDAVFEGD